MTKRIPVWARAEMRELLQELDNSGVTVAEFARRRGVNANRIYWARRQARAAAAPTSAPAVSDFGELVVAAAPSPRRAAAIELRVPSGAVVDVQRDFDEATLRRLLGVLLPC